MSVSNRPSVSLPEQRLRRLSIGAQSLGAMAVGALAVGALAFGAVAIGRFVIGRARIRRLEIDELCVGRLRVTEVLDLPREKSQVEQLPAHHLTFAFVHGSGVNPEAF